MSMTDSEVIERILYMGVGRRGLENENSCISKELNELKQYRAIGTVSEFRELKEKATAKVGLSRGQGHEAYLICPSCGSHMKDDQLLWYFDGEVVQCKKCKQLVLVDWSN